MRGELRPMDDLVKSDDTAAPDEQAVRRFAMAALAALENCSQIKIGDKMLVRVAGGSAIQRRKDVAR